MPIAPPNASVNDENVSLILDDVVAPVHLGSLVYPARPGSVNDALIVSGVLTSAKEHVDADPLAGAVLDLEAGNRGRDVANRDGRRVVQRDCRPPDAPRAPGC